MEINLFLVALMQQAGIEAKPVISSTRDHGKIHKNYPFDYQFNNVLAFVEGKKGPFLADGTEVLTASKRPLRHHCRKI